jgi:hypothetical protein
MLGALESLRTHTAESLGEAGISLTAPRHAEPPVDEAVAGNGDAADRDADQHVDPDADQSVDQDADNDDRDGEDGEDESEDAERRRGRTTRSGHLVDVLADLDGAGDDADDDDDPPLTATEAFLRSAHLVHGDPPLPPTDDTEVGARYARDAMRATARAKARRDEETLEIVPDRDPTHRRGRNSRSGPDERVTDQRPGADDADGQDSGDREDSEAAGKPLGWLFRS